MQFSAFSFECFFCFLFFLLDEFLFWQMGCSSFESVFMGQPQKEEDIKGAFLKVRCIIVLHFPLTFCHFDIDMLCRFILHGIISIHFPHRSSFPFHHAHLLPYITCPENCNNNPRACFDKNPT